VIEELVARWARDEENVRAAALMGSRARADTPADEWSDYDFVVFARDPGALLEDESWVQAFGTVRLSFLEATAVGGQRERRVLFADGTDVDFAIVPVAEIDHPAVAEVASRGARILVDKDAALEKRLTGLPPRSRPGPPEEQAFRETAMDFWYHAVWTARKLRRGELYIALECLDGHMKRLLVRVLEWHARSRDAETDTWHRGRFLERWADAGALQELRDAYAHYDAGDAARALVTTMDLFRRVATETAEGFGLDYPCDADGFATGIVHELSRDLVPRSAT
jgi:aminoglycoside 6-adenylyltransferase